MKNLFNMDNPFMQLLVRVGDLILANALFIICSLPVVTLGASLAALHKVTQNIVLDEEQGLFKTFLRGFKENFKQATLAWLMMLVFLVGMCCNLLLTVSYLSGTAALICKWVLYLIMLLMLALASYVFPLMVRYENSLREHFINAAILSIVKLPRTILLVILNALPVLIAYFSMQTFFSTLVFWLTLGFAFSSFITNTLLVSVFKELEANGSSNAQMGN